MAIHITDPMQPPEWAPKAVREAYISLEEAGSDYASAYGDICGLGILSLRAHRKLKAARKTYEEKWDLYDEAIQKEPW